MKELLVIFGINYGLRYTREEKIKFREILVNYYLKNDWTIRSLPQGRANHILCQSSLEIKKLFVIPYDTPRKFLKKGESYYPFSLLKQRKQAKQELSFLLLLSLTYALLIGFGLWISLLGTSYLRLFGILMIVISLVFWLRQMRTQSSQNNMNLNSAAIALMIKILEEDVSNYAVLYVDRYYQDYQWIGVLDELNKEASFEIVLLEGLAEGEKWFIRSNGISKFEESFSKEFEVTKLKADHNYVHVFSGCWEKEEVLIPNGKTEEDFHVDVKRLEKMYEWIIKYIGE